MSKINKCYLQVSLKCLFILLCLNTLIMSQQPCNFKHFKEIDLLKQTIINAIPKSSDSLVIIHEECHEIDNRISSLIFFMRFEYLEDQYLIFSQIDKKYEGKYFDNDVSLTYKIEFLHPETNINAGERILTQNKVFNISIKPGAKGRGWKLNGTPKFTKFGKKKKVQKNDKENKSEKSDAHEEIETKKNEKNKPEKDKKEDPAIKVLKGNEKFIQKQKVEEDKGVDVDDQKYENIDFDNLIMKTNLDVCPVNIVESRREEHLQYQISQEELDNIKTEQANQEFESDAWINEFTLDLEKYISTGDVRNLILNTSIDSIA